MKILHIIPTLSKGGAERLVLDIVKKLNSQNNIDARLVIFRDDIKYDVSEIKQLISIVPSSVQLSFMKKWKINVSDLQDYIYNFKPDIIHTHLFEAELVSRFCKYPKALWFSHVHDNLVQFKNWSWSNLTKVSKTNWYEKQVLLKQYKNNGGTHFIAISKHTESYINSVQFKYPVTLLHNAIDVKRFQKPADFNKSCTDSGSSPVENQPLDSNLYLNPQPQPLTLNLINIGSFVPKKNQTFLLDIILELNKKSIQTSCVFLGDGPHKMEVMNKAKELGILDQCNFLGNVENVEEYLWQSDVYTHTATYEPLGLVLIEAMAAGLPVVTLDGHGNRDLMENGKNGFILKEQDPKMFATKIIEVYRNQEIKEFNIHFARQYEIGNYVAKLQDLYYA